MNDLVDAFLDYLRAIKRRSPHTVISYSNDINAFVQYCIENYEVSVISDINHLMIRSWVVRLKTSGISNNSINRKISALKTFYKYLLRRSIVNSNPTSKVQTLKKAKRLPSFVPEKKMAYLLEENITGNSFVEIRNQLVVDLLYTSGMRRSELLGLKFSDIDQARQEIKVIGKGNKERRCPITEKLQYKLQKYKDALNEEFGQLDHDYVIVTKKGKRGYPKLVYKIVSNALKSINAAEKTSPHVLRHTFATHLSSNGAELNAVKELLGHASLAATQVYTHTSIERLQKEYKRAHPLGE